MPERGGFLSGLRGLGLRVADRFVSGQNYNSQTGQWSATPGQYVTGIGSKVLGLVNPALGMVSGRVADSYYDTGSLIPTGNGPLARLFGKGTQQGLDQALSNSQSSMMAQINAGNGYAAPVAQATLPSPSQAPTMPAVNTQAPWSPMSPFAPGSGLAFAGMPQGRPIGGNLGFGGGHYNNGVGAGTGFGAANYVNDGWGDVASGFGIGATSHGSGGSFALADAQKAAKINRI